MLPDYKPVLDIKQGSSRHNVALGWFCTNGPIIFNRFVATKDNCHITDKLCSKGFYGTDLIFFYRLNSLIANLETNGKIINEKISYIGGFPFLPGPLE